MSAETSAGSRYLIIDGRRWRRSDPAIPETLRSELVKALMSARRAVAKGQRAEDKDAVAQARSRVQDAKLALGERGRAWWLPRQPQAMDRRLRAAIRALLRKRGAHSAICPSEAARIAGGRDWPQRHGACAHRGARAGQRRLAGDYAQQ